MIDKIGNNKIQDFFEKSSSKQTGSADALPNNDEDVSVQVNYASLIDQEMQISQTSADTVQRARELVLSGRLDTPANARRAAEHILNYGI